MVVFLREYEFKVVRNLPVLESEEVMAKQKTYFLNSNKSARGNYKSVSQRRWLVLGVQLCLEHCHRKGLNYVRDIRNKEQQDNCGELVKTRKPDGLNRRV